jgi:hypothetical protein
MLISVHARPFGTSHVRAITGKVDWHWLRGPDPGATVTKVIMGSLPDPNRL